MFKSTSTNKGDIRETQSQTMGIGSYPKTDQRISNRSSGKTQQERKKTKNGSCRRITEESEGTTGSKGCPDDHRIRTDLVKKKSELGVEGKITGHFPEEKKEAIVSMVIEAMSEGITQKETCDIISLCPRKYRRWRDHKPRNKRIAWNRLRPEEEQAIKDSVYKQELIGKPLSHYYIYGHEKGSFYASISTIYRVLKENDLLQPVQIKRKKQGYVSAHTLLEEGFSLMCYDGTTFKTETGMSVIAMPVLLLPLRYLLHVGHSIKGESAVDLKKAVEEGLLRIPETTKSKLIAHSDRGSAMKSRTVVHYLKNENGIPVHYGRPRTPDDVPWIEALNRTMKYHRDAPERYPMVQDVLDWLNRFKEIYNNDPHSALKYVTPSQALEGKMEVILKQRKENVELARKARREAYYASKQAAGKGKK